MEERNFQELKKKASYLLESIKEKVGNTDVVLEARNQMMNLLDDIKKLEKEHQDSLSEFTNVLHAHVMEFMTSDLKHMKEEASLKIQAALNEKELHEVRVAFLGKKGRLTGILRMMKNLSDEVRPQMGAMANQIRNEIESMESRKKEELKNKILMEKIESEKIDITLPARHDRRGHIHPLNKALRTIVKSFTRMGYSVEEGPEIESDYYNFYCLNLPKDHPARDMQDSFYITPDILLRTQTSPVQIVAMPAHPIANCSATIATVKISNPAPPYSLGIANCVIPDCFNMFIKESGTIPFLSIIKDATLISSCAIALASSTTSLCLGVSEKSIIDLHQYNSYFLHYNI